MTLGGWNIAKIEVKGQRSSKIWQPLKKDIKSHSVVTVSRQKLMFGRMIEVQLFMENDLGQGQGHNRRSQRSNFGPKFRLDLLSTHGIMGNYGQ